MAIGFSAKLQTFFNRLTARIDSRLNLDEIDRYWRYPRSGDAYLEAYQHSRRLSGSTDDLAKQMRFHTLMQAVQHVIDRQVAGDVVECGCWRGHSTHMIAQRLHTAGWQGHFFVFDSFAGGLSGKVAKDRSLQGDTDGALTASQKNLFASDKDAVAAVLQPFDFVSLHEGWIPAVFEQVDGLSARHYALVHIDVDLYEPVLATLRYFGPRMTAGGIIVVDDYASSHFPGATVAVDEYMAEHPPRLAIAGQTGGMLLFY